MCSDPRDRLLRHGRKLLDEADSIMDRQAKQIERQRAALQFVLDWLNGKPTPKGWIIGHGTKEVRAVVEEALQ